MAVPKRKTSVSKKKMRRSHHKISSLNIVEDKKSGEYRLSHHIDLKSGYYNGKKILDIQYNFMDKKITIAIDAMGGDNSPEKTINGVGLFIKENSLNNDFQLNLFGDENKINEKLKKYNIPKCFQSREFRSSV